MNFKKSLLLTTITTLFTVIGCQGKPDPIIEDDPVLSSIEIVGEPVTTYVLNDEFIKPTVQATYSDETTKVITDDCSFEGYDMTVADNYTVNVSYTEEDITKATSYSISVEAPAPKLKFAIFADIQLCNTTGISGEAAENLGSTANSALALESHFKFIKENNINVVLMNGDITNQANEYYYQNFESILKKVYGTDETKYPEFLWNMGNHEWWWGTSEKESGDAVSMFKSHARIETPNLVAQSKVKYQYNNSVNVPSYYKVINGVPFIVISAESSAGNVGAELENEIRSWLVEAKMLQSVQQGGPIFVQYHYPLTTSMTHGQGASDTCATVENIFKDTPNAVIFTGDTHFPGINERSINQVNFTTINLGSSSYSRMVDQSAVICDNYANVSGTGAKIDDKLVGNVKFKEAYTPTIQVVDISSDNSYTIDRYFTDVEGGRKVGEQWSFNKIKSKQDFTYTNERFQSKDAAKELYDAEGLSWDTTDAVTFGIDATNRTATVHFPDVKEHHFVEHYLVTLNGKEYDFVSNYYKYPENRENNYYILENIDIAESYQVTVTAYDFFDNPSLNSLSSATPDDSKSVDAIDYAATLTYTDIQTRNRFDQVADENSNSSIEYYYKGKYLYNSGAILNRLYYANKTDSCNNYISLSNDENETPIVTVSVKNLKNTKLAIGLSVIIYENNKETWKDDFDSTVKWVESDNWENLTWNLKTAYGVDSKSKIAGIFLKAKSAGASSDGYEMNFLLDNIDIVGKNAPVQEEVYSYAAGTEYNMTMPKVATGEKFTMDFKFTTDDSSKKINICFWQQIWDGNNYLGYYEITPKGLTNSYSGLSWVTLDNGFIRVTFDTALMNKVGNNSGVTNPLTEINSLYIRANWSNASCQFKINSTQGNVVRGEEFTAGKDFSKNLTPISTTDGTLVVDFKIISGDKFSIMFGDKNSQGWNDYFGYFSIDSSITSDKFDGIAVTALPDGYIRLTITFSQITKVNPGGNRPAEVNLVYIRGIWCEANGYIDINPTI